MKSFPENVDRVVCPVVDEQVGGDRLIQENRTRPNSSRLGEKHNEAHANRAHGWVGGQDNV